MDEPRIKLTPSRERRRKLKAQAIELKQEGYVLAEIANALGVTSSTVCLWTKGVKRGNLGL